MDITFINYDLHR